MITVLKSGEAVSTPCPKREELCDTLISMGYDEENVDQVLYSLGSDDLLKVEVIVCFVEDGLCLYPVSAPSS